MVKPFLKKKKNSKKCWPWFVGINSDCFIAVIIGSNNNNNIVVIVKVQQKITKLPGIYYHSWEI